VYTQRFGQKENKWSIEHDQFDTSGTREFSLAVSNFSKRLSTSAGWRRKKKRKQQNVTVEEG